MSEEKSFSTKNKDDCNSLDYNNANSKDSLETSKNTIPTNLEEYCLENNHDENNIIWDILKETHLEHYRIFDISSLQCQLRNSQKKFDFYVINTSNWVNVIPVTTDGCVVFVKQFRHGIKKITLEIPGGMVDKNESPLSAAKRELQEETGYFSDKWTEIGALYPNPAIQSNICHTFLAENCIPKFSQETDENEDIICLKIPINKIRELIQSGQIQHALVLDALFFWLLQHADFQHI